MTIINNFTSVGKKDERTTLQKSYFPSDISIANYEPLPASDSPFLLLKEKGNKVENEISDPLFTFMSVPSGNIYSRRIHALDNKLFLGSHFGWIFIQNLLLEPSMFNPLTGEEIPLPSITIFPDIHVSYTNADCNHMCYLYLEDLVGFNKYTNENINNLSGRLFTKFIVSRKPTSSSSNFIVAAIYGYPEKLAFVRTGESRWNLIEDYKYSDIIFRHDGSLLALEFSTCALHIYRFGDEDFWVEKMSIGKPDEDYFENDYLVETDEGELLLVRRSCDVIEEGTITCGVELLQLVLGDYANEDKKNWQHIEDLAGGALFLGTNASLLLHAKDVKGAIQPDCIYFTDNWWEVMSRRVRDCYRDICVYSLKEDTIELFCPLELSRYNTWPLPIWFSF